MKLKKIFINLFIISLAFILFVVWYQSNREKTVQALSSPAMKKYKVYLITTDKEFQYWNYLNQGASDLAAAIGVTYVWDAPAGKNVNEQIQVINNAVNNGANALLIAADDPKSISSAIEDAKAKSVKIIYVDSPAYEEAITTLASDNYEAGVLAGRSMIEEMDKAGIKGGSIGIISVSKKENSALREEGFRKTITDDGRYTLLDTVYTNGDISVAQEAAKRVIADHKELVGLFGTNEGTSQGVGNAIKEDNNQIIGIGFDKTDAMLKLLNDGSIKAIINQNPYTMGYLGMAEAIAAILGKDTGPSYINTGVSVVE